jgi:hypothetical protein
MVVTGLRAAKAPAMAYTKIDRVTENERRILIEKKASCKRVDINGQTCPNDCDDANTHLCEVEMSTATNFDENTNE